MARGFVYLSVVLDWFSRRVLSWRASITMEAAFCVETLEDALARHGRPDTSIQIKVRSSRERPSPACSPTMTLRSAWMARGPGGITCSSSGYGAAFKYAEVHLRAYDSVGEARASIGRYLDFYNAGDRIRALTARHPIKPTSPRCQSGWQPNPGRRSTYRRGKKFRQPGPPLPEVAQL
jgi:putative transposase